MAQSEISFEEYCVDIEEVPYYNFLTEEEREYLTEKYYKYLEKRNEDMRQEYLSNDRIKSIEPKLHRHLCIHCGVIYEDFEEEDGICDVCRDETEEWI